MTDEATDSCRMTRTRDSSPTAWYDRSPSKWNSFALSYRGLKSLRPLYREREMRYNLEFLSRSLVYRDCEPNRPVPCVKLVDLRSRSVTSIMARLTSDDELHESSCAEFLRETRAASAVWIVAWPPLSHTCRAWSADAVPPEGTASAPCSVLGPGADSHGHTSSIGRTATSVAPASLTTGTLLYLVFTVCSRQVTTRFARVLHVCMYVGACVRVYLYACSFSTSVDTCMFHSTARISMGLYTYVCAKCPGTMKGPWPSNER